MKRDALPPGAMVRRAKPSEIAVFYVLSGAAAIFDLAMALQWENDMAKLFLLFGVITLLLLLRHSLRPATGYVALAGDMLYADSFVDHAVSVDLSSVTGYSLEVEQHGNKLPWDEVFCLYAGERRVLSSKELPVQREWVRLKLYDRHYPPAFFAPESAERFQLGNLTVEGADLILKAGTDQEQRVPMCMLHLEEQGISQVLALPDGTRFACLDYTYPHVFRLAWVLSRNGVNVEKKLPML